MVTAAPACKAALAEATRLWPQRLRVSDGILASEAHIIASPTSDHSRGNAVDLTHDPAHGVDCGTLSKLAMSDPRTKYIIWDGRIWNPAVAARWREYTGVNPHTKHCHISIWDSHRNDTSSWWTPDPPKDRPVANKPFVALLAHPDGSYLRVGADGGIFAHGPVNHFHGALGDVALNQSVVGAALTPSFRGYWLATADGGVFAFGDAIFHGSTGAIALNKPVVDIAANDDGGYLLVAQDGGVFPFGPGAAFHGAEQLWAG